MAKVGKFYMVGCNQYFVAERITKECWAGAVQTSVRLIMVNKDEAKFSLRPDFAGMNELPEPAFDRVAEEIQDKQ